MTAFLAAPEGMAIYALIVVALVDFLLSVAAAFRDGTFKLDVVMAFLRSQIAGRVFPITVLLAFGYFGNQPGFTVLGLAASAGYVAETIGSINASWGPGHAVQAVPTD